MSVELTRSTIADKKWKTRWTTWKFFDIMEQLEFNSFLLHLGNELESNEFEALKFVLKGYVTSSKCEEMVQVFKYFEEMERLCLLSPTNFLVLKIALGLIGRPDLVKKIEGKEVYFATLFRESIKEDNSLDRKGLYQRLFWAYLMFTISVISCLQQVILNLTLYFISVF